ncbi:MAG: dihydrofolate reductase [Patescibacteria group bacterium]
MINIIAAIGKNRELGKDNKLLWHIPEDFKRFKDLTSGHVIIMGRKTYESLPENFRPLPNRVNIVITRDKKFTISSRSKKDGNSEVIICNSLEEAIKVSDFEISASNLNNEVFIIGGASIYEQGIKHADKLYLTLIDKDYPDADAFFPEYGEFGKEVVVGEGVEEDLRYKFVELIK